MNLYARHFTMCTLDPSFLESIKKNISPDEYIDDAGFLLRGATPNRSADRRPSKPAAWSALAVGPLADHARHVIACNMTQEETRGLELRLRVTRDARITNRFWKFFGKKTQKHHGLSIDVALPRSDWFKVSIS